MSQIGDRMDVLRIGMCRTFGARTPPFAARAERAIFLARTCRDDVHHWPLVQSRANPIGARAGAGDRPRPLRRRLGAAWVASVLILAGCSSGGGDGSPAPTRGESLVAQENRKPGSDEWQFWRYGFARSDDADEQVKGYASATSVDRGERLTLSVSVNPPQTYTIDVYRIGWYGGLGGSLVTTVGPLPGNRQPECPVDTTTGLIACAWEPSYSLEILPSWVSGIYLAVVRNQQRFASFIMFVVRDDERAADVLYQQSVTTYQAYNDYPSDGRRGKSLYGGSFGPPTIAGDSRAVQVSFDRPYATDGAGQFLAWEVGFVRWLERSGYDIRYTTDVDTHLHGEQLLASKAFLSVGHDEYWSKEMFDAVERARDAGVHLGFFGGNDAYWQIRFAPSATGTPARVMVCYKRAALDPVQGETTTVKWRDPPVTRPEQPLIGLQFGDIIRDGIDGTYAGYVVRNGDHWVYAGTGLHDGDVIPGIVGYETDRYDEDMPLPPQRGGSWTLLSRSPYESFVGAPSYANSAVYQAPSGAWVFAAGSIGWSLGLDAFPTRAVPDDRLQRTTRNILDRFVQ
jgi:hypothetical protein